MTGNGSMELRRLSAGDGAIITDLFKDVFTNGPWYDDWSDLKQLDAYISDLTGQANSLTLGYFGGDRLAALAMGYVKHWHAGTEYCVEEFCVARQSQGRGVGSAFLEAIEAFLPRIGIRRIFLQTDRHVPACAFYAHRGFTELKDHVSFVKRIDG